MEEKKTYSFKTKTYIFVPLLDCIVMRGFWWEQGSRTEGLPGGIQPREPG